MNYVCVLIVAVAIFAIGYWYAAGRYYYIGPRVRTQIVVGVDGDKGMDGGKLSPGQSSEERGKLSPGGSSEEKREME